MKNTVRRHAARILLSTVVPMLGALAFPAQAQVTPFNTGGAEVRAFRATTATTVYAAAFGGGLYRSTNAGASWTRINLPNNDRYLTSIAGNTSTTITVGAEEGLYTATDGLTFTKRLSEPVAAVAMGTGASTTVLAGVKGVGIFRSTNSGVNFSLVTAGLTGTDVTAMAEDPTNANTFYVAMKPDGAGNRGGVFKSTDGGANWAATAVIPGGTTHVFGLAVDSAGNAYAAAWRPSDGGGGIYFLLGGAGAWNLSGNTFGNVSVHRDANVGTSMWGGGRSLGITQATGAPGSNFNYKAPNNGAAPSFFYTSINAIATMPGNNTIALKAVKGAGVWRSTDANAGTPNWTRVSFPGAERVLSASGFSTANPNSIFLGLHAGGIWLSNDNGVNWVPPTVNAGRADFAYSVSPNCATTTNPFNSIWEIAASNSNPNLVYVAAGNVGMHYGNDGPGIFRWNGSFWAGISSVQSSGAPCNITQEAGARALPSEPVYGVRLNSANDQILYASYLGPNFGSLVSNNGTWTASALPFGLVPQIRTTVSSTASSSRVIALPFDDKPIKSEASGASGTYSVVNVAQSGFERLRFFAVAENPTNGNFWLGASNKGVFRSTDAGASWTRVAAGFATQAISAVGYKSTGRVFIADRMGNRYCSPDNGVNWTTLTGGPLRAGVNAIRVVNGQLYYLTDGAGAFREDLSC